MVQVLGSAWSWSVTAEDGWRFIGGPLVNGGRLIKAVTGELVWRQCQTLPLSLNDYHHPITHTSYHIILQNVFHEDHHNNIRFPHENMARGHFNSCIDFPQLFIFIQLQLQAWLHRFHLSPVIWSHSLGLAELKRANSAASVVWPQASPHVAPHMAQENSSACL